MISSSEEQDQIELIRSAILNKKAKWAAGKTSVSQLSHEEFKQLCGVLIEPVPEELRQKPAAPVAVPSQFDWRNKDYLDWTTTIKNQLGCNCCYAFGVLAALEAQYNIQTGIPNTNKDLSEQYLVSCFAGDCSGRAISDTLNWLKTLWKPLTAETGTPDEDCFPYEAEAVPCENTCAGHLDRLYHLKDWGWVSTNREDIKNYILIAPVPATMMAYTDFKFYLGGIYEHSWGDEVGYHEVTIVGWDDTNECWICKNSWGSFLWGEDGWFRIKYGECEIENWVAQYDRVGKGFGTINCTTSPPGAYIYLDDTPTGYYTPHTFANIAAYSYRIKFQLGGYSDCYREIYITDGEFANVHCDMVPIITPTPTATPTPTPTAIPTATPTPTATPPPIPRFRFDTAPVIFYVDRWYQLGETIHAHTGDDFIAYADVKEVNGVSGVGILYVDDYGTGENLCLNWANFSGNDTQSISCAFDMPGENIFVAFRACYGAEVTDEVGWIYLSLTGPTPTPTATPTATPTPTGTPTPTATPLPALGECILPRVVTGKLTPRVDNDKVFYRMKCLQDKWG